MGLSNHAKDISSTYCGRASWLRVVGLRETMRGVGNVGGQLGVRVSQPPDFILDPHRTIFLATRQERIKPNISDPNGQHGHPLT